MSGVATGYLIKRRIHRVFGQLSRGDFESILAGTRDDVRHSFPGQHALAGRRQGRDSLAAWFHRLHRLFPVHDFEVTDVISRGPPWDLQITVRWQARLEPVAGPPYRNEGVHWIGIRWGRLAELQAYLDSHAVADSCATMAHAGVAEANAPALDSTSHGPQTSG